MSVFVWPNTEPVYSYLWDGSQPVPAAMKAMPYGYRSVDDMLARQPFYWAHRGLSIVYPEMTLKAYTGAVRRGFGALEVSVARTSDGVWFGLHDRNLARTSPGAPATDADDMTWSQVQQYRVQVPNGNEPYMRLEELVEAYGQSHILIFDAKYQWTLESWDSLFEVLAPVPTERLIGKAYGAGRNFAEYCHARGVKTWGFYYKAEVDSGTFAQYQDAYDLLGLTYSDPQSTWDTVLATGKPVIAHICPNQAAVDTGMTKGAVGFQCSGPITTGNGI